MPEQTTQFLNDVCGNDFSYEIKGKELFIYYKNSFVSFQWPLLFNWSVEKLRWHILDRLGLRNPGLLPPRW